MNDNFFMIHVKGGKSPTYKYSNREDAELAAQSLSAVLCKEVVIMVADSIIKPSEINVIVNSYEAALTYLNWYIDQPVFSYHNKYDRSITAMYKLIIIAEAWNKADEFIPDFDNFSQCKWFPCFKKQGTEGFISDPTYTAGVRTHAYFGSRLYFKTEERANQFGKQFIDLWNDFLLFK